MPLVVGKAQGGHFLELSFVLFHPCVDRLRQLRGILSHEPGNGFEAIDEVGELALATKEELLPQGIIDSDAVGDDVAIAIEQMTFEFVLRTHDIHPDRTSDAPCILVCQFIKRAESCAIEFEIALCAIERQDNQLAIRLNAVQVETLRSVGRAEHTEFARLLLLASKEEKHHD